MYTRKSSVAPRASPKTAGDLRLCFIIVEGGPFAPAASMVAISSSVKEATRQNQFSAGDASNAGIRTQVADLHVFFEMRLARTRTAHNSFAG
jgi:hypothetical protein